MSGNVQRSFTQYAKKLLIGDATISAIGALGVSPAKSLMTCVEHSRIGYKGYLAIEHLVAKFDPYFGVLGEIGGPGFTVGPFPPRGIRGMQIQIALIGHK